MLLTLGLLAAAGPALATDDAASAPTGGGDAGVQCLGPPCDQINMVCRILFRGQCLG